MTIVNDMHRMSAQIRYKYFKFIRVEYFKYYFNTHSIKLVLAYMKVNMTLYNYIDYSSNQENAFNMIVNNAIRFVIVFCTLKI